MKNQISIIAQIAAAHEAGKAFGLPMDWLAEKATEEDARKTRADILSAHGIETEFIDSGFRKSYKLVLMLCGYSPTEECDETRS